MLRRAQAAIAGRLPTLATRFGLGESACWRAEDPTLDRALIARSLGWLFLVGASVSVVWLLLPHVASSDDRLVWVATIGAYAVAAVLFVGYDRPPPVALKSAVAVAAMASTMALYANHESGSAYQLFYLWPTLYAYCFFSARQAFQTALVGAVFGGVLIAQRDLWTEEIARWLLMMCTIVAAGTLIRSLTGSLRRTTR